MKIRTISWLSTAICAFGLTGATAAPAATQQETTANAPAAEDNGTVTVLGYGAVSKKKGALDPEEFRKQMSYLRSSGLTPISLQDFINWREGHKKLPKNAVLLTFEDANADFMASVLPALRQCGFPFLLFVDTQQLGSTAGYITERDLGVVSRTGGSVGVCTHTPNPGKEWKQAELRGNSALNTLAESRLGAPARRLTELCGFECVAFSHFASSADVAVLRELVRTGYSIAFSRNEGKATQDSPVFLVPRFMVKNRTDFAKAFGISKDAAAATPALPTPQGTVEQPKASEPKQEPAPAPEPVPAPHPTPEPAPAPAPTPDPSTAPAPSTAPVLDFEDDCVAVDDDEPAEAPDATATTPAEGATEPEEEEVLEVIPTTPVTPTYAKLGKRTPEGDWVTTSFTQPLVPREKTKVAVLGYHNFSNTKPITEMRMRTHVFCQQMQYIKDAGIAVITMKDFMEWRMGTRQLPARCVLITIDDGWKSVYTDAYPVLKAYGFPFTVFLYTKYIDVKGDSMTSEQIKEMQAHGATVGSHSTTHLYPRFWRRYDKNPEAYANQIQTEILDSGTVLSGKFGPCTAYCYPGGYNTQQMRDALKASPFRVAFTVLERKVECMESRYEVHRYMVFGNDHRIFRRAVNFDGEAGVKPTASGIAAAEAAARKFFPKAFENIPAAEQPKTPAAPATPEGATEGTAPAADTTTPAEATTTPDATEAAPAEGAPAAPKKTKGKKRKKK